MRKPPVRHLVSPHYRGKEFVGGYWRGRGGRTRPRGRVVYVGGRQEWIKRVKDDFDSVMNALQKYMKEIDPTWKILRVDIAGSFGEYLRGRKTMFKTPYGGVSGEEEREGKDPRARYLSDLDVVIWVSEDVNKWYKGNIHMTFEGDVWDHPEKYGLKSRGGEGINMSGKFVRSKYMNDIFRLPLDEPDLRKTHDVIVHMRKPSEKGIFGMEWKQK